MECDFIKKLSPKFIETILDIKYTEYYLTLQFSTRHFGVKETSIPIYVSREKEF